jgi:hypothetical protein
MTSPGFSTPVVAASDAFTRPRNRAVQVSGRRISAEVDKVTLGAIAMVSGSMSGCRNRLNSTRPSAPASSRRCAISPVELKKGLNLTATGIVTAARVVAHPAVYCGERVVGHQLPPRLLVMSGASKTQPRLDVFARGAAGVARGQQVDVDGATIPNRSGARLTVQQIGQRREVAPCGSHGYSICVHALRE